MSITNLNRVYNGEYIKIVVELYDGDFLDIIHKEGKVSRYQLHEDYMDTCIHNINMIITDGLSLYEALEIYVEEGNLKVIIHEESNSALVVKKINSVLYKLNNFSPETVRQVLIDFEARKIIYSRHSIDIEGISGDAATYEFRIHGVVYYGWSSEELHSGYISETLIKAQPRF